MNKISLVMIVKDEEKYIKRCLDSVKQTVDEMIVVDTGSSDRTKEIAQQTGAKVFDFEWSNDFSAARNYALSLATGDWILSLDADEQLKKDYREAIEEHIEKGKQIGRIKIISMFEDNGQICEAHAYISRLFPRGIIFAGRIHEQLQSDLPRVIVPIEILHDGYFQTDKTERNIPLLEKELEENPQNAYCLYQMGKEYRNRKDYKLACTYFSRSYQLLSKRENYAPNVIVEYISGLNKAGQYKAALDVIQKEEPFLQTHPDFHFHKGIVLMNDLSTNPSATMTDVQKIEQAFLRCLEIGNNHTFESVAGTESFLAAYNVGLLYELFGLREKAVYYYQMSAQHQYQPAVERLTHVK